jgi:CRP-like cAMP-binding protein
MCGADPHLYRPTMMAVAVPFARSRFLDQFDHAAARELRRACPAVIVRAGSRRVAAELPAARVLIVEDGVVLTRSFAGEGVRSMIVGRSSAGAVLPAPAADELLHALTDAWLTALPHAVWRRLAAIPEVADQLLAGLEETLRRQREASRALAAIRNTDRVRLQLVELAREHGRVGRDGIRIDLPLTHDLIADMVGCARETVTRAFDELQRQGFVERCGGSYQLRVSPESLYA